MSKSELATADNAYRRSVQSEAKGIFAFLGVIWLAFAIDWSLPVELTAYGLVPRTAQGLVGIPLMPLLHGSLAHLTGNTLPLVVLLGLLAGSRCRTWRIVAEVVFLSGLLLWLLGRPAIHIGASGLVFGLATFLVVAGFLERRPIALAIAAIVILLYGSSLASGVLPWAGSQISWDGHLCGAVAGGLLAYQARPRGSAGT